jgi:peptidoglycan-associated lipoprotein
MRNHLRQLTLVILVAVLSACSSTPLREPSNTPVTDQSTGKPPTADSSAVKNVQAGVQDDLASGALAKRSIYFDYDSFVVKDEFKSVIDAHARYLLSHKNRKIVIQGNADERGGSEYNLSLGQKRAEAVRRALSLLGVPEAQVEAVSFGKEKPKSLGHDEAAWAENRRADIVYQ